MTNETAMLVAQNTLAFLNAVEAKPAALIRKDGRREVRYLDRVLMEAPDRGGDWKVELYQTDPDGIELFVGYMGKIPAAQ